MCWYDVKRDENMSENKQGSNLSYPVPVEKLEKLLQERLGQNAAVSKIEDMLEEQNVIAGSTYKRILNERKATEKTLKILAEFLNCDFTKLIAENSETVKERKRTLTDIKDNLEKAEPVVLDGISELFERMMPLNSIIKDTDAIGYKNNGDGNYEVVVPLSSDWGELAGQVKTYKITVKREENKTLEQVLIDRIQRKLRGLISRNNLNENPNFENLIDTIGNRKIVEILPPPNVYMKILVENYFKAMTQELDKNGRKAGQFQEGDVIEYFDLGDGVFDVTLPLDEDYCCQLGLDFPLKLEVELPDDLDEEADFEEALRGAIEDQFHSDYDCLIEDDDWEEEFNEKMGELYNLPLEESIVHDFEELDLKDNPRSHMCYTTLFQVLYLRGETDEIPKIVSDAGYAYRKFEQFGIPAPIGKKIWKS